MKIEVVSSTLLDEEAAVKDLHTQLSHMRPSLLILGFEAGLSAQALVPRLRNAFNCPVIGGSSCKGVLTIGHRKADSSAKLSALAIEDVGGCYGVGQQKIQHCARQAAQGALEMALYASGRPYESPDLIWCVLPPGEEESILEGFADVVGEAVPVFGGSSADNEIKGAWQQLTHLDCGDQQISVAVLFPSTGLSAVYSSGYEPTGKTFTVSEVEGRKIARLDGELAAERYNEEAGGIIEGQLAGGTVLDLTTLSPLGRKICERDGMEDYLLSHPEAVTETGALTLFSTVNTGETLHLMHGSRTSLRKRAHRVVASAIKLLPQGLTPKGVLMIYCAGCMLALEDDITEMTNDLKCHFSGIPILGLYTFGEQGCAPDGKSRHGNLMISAVVFG